MVPSCGGLHHSELKWLPPFTIARAVSAWGSTSPQLTARVHIYNSSAHSMHTGLHAGSKFGDLCAGESTCRTGHIGSDASQPRGINGLGGNMEQLQYDFACPVALGGTRHGGYAPYLYLGSTGPTGRPTATFHKQHAPMKGSDISVVSGYTVRRLLLIRIYCTSSTV